MPLALAFAFLRCEPSLPPPSSSDSAAQGLVSIEAADVDPTAATRGLELRAGERLHGWSIRVRSSDVRSELEVTMRAPDGSESSQTVVLTSSTVEDRSRELASVLAWIIEQHDSSPREHPPPPESSTPKPTPARAGPTRQTHEPDVHGWLGVGPRVGIGVDRKVVPDYGGTMQGGLSVWRDHLQPQIRFGWSGSFAKQLVFHGMRIGAGLGAGSLVRRRWWFGGDVVPGILWVRAVGVRAVSSVSLTSEVTATVQFRGRHGLLVGARLGVDVTLPPLLATGQGESLRWGIVRFMVGLYVGFHT